MIVLDFFATLAESVSMAYLFHDKEKAGWTRAVLGLVLNMLLVEILTNFNVSLIPKFYMVFSLQTLLARYVYRGSWNKSVVLVIIFQMAISIGELPVQSVLHIFINENLTFASGNTKILIPSVIIAKIIMIVFVIIMKKYFGKIQFHFPKYVLALFLIPSLLLENVALKMSDIFLGVTSHFEIQNKVLFSFLVLAAVFSVVAVLYYYIYIRELEYEKNLSYEQIALKYQYYEDKAENIKRIHSLYHDMKEHILIMQELLDEKERKDYAEKLLLDVEDASPGYRTGNEMMDIILNDKKKVLKDRKIKLSISGDYRMLNFISNKDVVTIFSNALNNAIEACYLVKGERIISIKLIQKQQFFLWRFENTYEEKSSNISSLHTTKKNKEMHGWGIKNVDQTIRKYQGDCCHKTENSLFCLELFFQGYSLPFVQESEATA